MIQVLPQQPSLSNTLGQTISGGLQRGMERGNEIGFQRGLINKALAGLQNLPPDASDLDKTSYLLKATTGLQDQGRILQALAPMILGRGRVEQLYGEQPGGVPATGTATPSTIELANKAASERAPPQPERKYGGFIQPILNPAEINQYASNYARTMQTPEAYQIGMREAQAKNAEAQSAREKIWNEAGETNKWLTSHPDMKQFFLQEVEKLAHVKDPTELVQKANEAFRKGMQADIEGLERGEIPGPFKGAVQKLGSLAGTSGTIASAFLKGGVSREEAIKAFNKPVKRLIDKGLESVARSYLGTHGLSSTEIEEVIHPFTPKTLAQISNMPSAESVPAKAQPERLERFLRDNVNGETSLLALRHRLWNEKGYDWKEIANAFDSIQASPKPLKLEEWQKRELFDVEQTPPIQSLSDIFHSKERFLQYLSGAK